MSPTVTFRCLLLKSLSVTCWFLLLMSISITLWYLWLLLMFLSPSKVCFWFHFYYFFKNLGCLLVHPSIFLWCFCLSPSNVSFWCFFLIFFFFWCLLLPSQKQTWCFRLPLRSVFDFSFVFFCFILSFSDVFFLSFYLSSSNVYFWLVFLMHLLLCFLCLWRCLHAFI